MLPSTWRNPVWHQLYGEKKPKNSPKQNGTRGRYDRIAEAWEAGELNSVDALMGQAEPYGGLRTRDLGTEPPIGEVRVSFMPCLDCGKPHHRKEPCPRAVDQHDHALAA